jgi:hypothetical protein
METPGTGHEPQGETEHDPQTGRRREREFDLDEEYAAEEADAGFDWERLRRLWSELPDYEWTEERANRIFAGIMARLERRQRWRHRLKWAAALLPLCGVVVWGGIRGLQRRR